MAHYRRRYERFVILLTVALMAHVCTAEPAATAAALSTPPLVVRRPGSHRRSTMPVPTIERVTLPLPQTIPADPIDADVRKEKRKSMAQREAMVNVIAGAFGSMLGECVSFPVDLMKTTAQTSPPGTTIVGLAQQLWKEKGPVGIFAGLPSPMLGAFLIKSFVFGGYEVSKYGIRLLRKSTSTVEGEPSTTEPRPLTFKESTVAKLGAGAFGSLAFAPVDRVKIMMQLEGGDTTFTTFGMAWMLFRSGTLFTGLGATLAREVPFNVVYFMVYERVRSLFLSRSDQNEGAGTRQHEARPPWWMGAVGGGVAGVMAWVATMPMDVAKTRVQAGRESNLGLALVRAFTDGTLLRPDVAGPVLFRALLKHAVVFLVYEMSRPTIRRAIVGQPVAAPSN